MTIIKERIYNAPIEKVWQALTNLDQMKQWYFDLDDFKPEIGFKFQFYGQGSDGTKMLHLCEVKEVVEGSKITYSWTYDNLPGYSLLTWELEPQGNNTLLKLTHTGLETFAENGPDFATTSFNGGWDHFVNKALLEFLEV